MQRRRVRAGGDASAIALPRPVDETGLERGAIRALLQLAFDGVRPA